MEIVVFVLGVLEGAMARTSQPRYVLQNFEITIS